MNDIDRNAFTRAIALMQAEDAGSHGRELIDALLAKQQSFEETGESAAYYCQCKALRLKPWQSPPIYAAPRLDGPVAEQLAHRLRAAGLSKYEPDVLGALERIERAA
jgi:hypothetical protein